MHAYPLPLYRQVGGLLGHRTSSHLYQERREGQNDRTCVGCIRDHDRQGHRHRHSWSYHCRVIGEADQWHTSVRLNFKHIVSANHWLEKHVYYVKTVLAGAHMYQAHRSNNNHYRPYLGLSIFWKGNLKLQVKQLEVQERQLEVQERQLDHGKSYESSFSLGSRATSRAKTSTFISALPRSARKCPRADSFTKDTDHESRSKAPSAKRRTVTLVKTSQSDLAPGPRTIILDGITYPVQALLQHEIVIRSYSFLRNRYHEANDYD